VNNNYDEFFSLLIFVYALVIVPDYLSLIIGLLRLIRHRCVNITRLSLCFLNHSDFIQRVNLKHVNLMLIVFFVMKQICINYKTVGIHLVFERNWFNAN